MIVRRLGNVAGWLALGGSLLVVLLPYVPGLADTGDHDRLTLAEQITFSVLLLGMGFVVATALWLLASIDARLDHLGRKT